MGPISALSSFFIRCFDLSGRSRRSEFAWMLIIQTIALLLMVLTLGSIEGGFDSIDEENLSAAGKVLSSVFGLIWLGTTIPWVTLSIRRFHDMGYTGWMVALFTGLWIIPPIGALGSIVQFFWLLFGGGTPGVNAYAQDPRFSR